MQSFVSMEIQSENVLRRLAKAISSKYGIIVELHYFPSRGYCLICRDNKTDPFGMYVSCREKSANVNLIYFNTIDEFLLTLSDNAKLYIYSPNGEIVIDVAKEFGKTIEELEINCDLQLSSKN